MPRLRDFYSWVLMMVGGLKLHDCNSWNFIPFYCTIIYLRQTYVSPLFNAGLAC